MSKVFLVKVPEQELEVEANDEADAEYEARELIDIDSIEEVDETT